MMFEMGRHFAISSLRAWPRISAEIVLLALATPVAADVNLLPRGPLDVESAVLTNRFQDPTYPTTTAAVMGVRRVEAISATQVRMVIGEGFNRSDAENNPDGFSIYSPDDANYAFDRFVTPSAVSVTDQPDAVTGVGSDADLVMRHIITLTLPSAMKSGAVYYVRAIGGRKGTQDSSHYRVPWQGAPITSGANAGHFTFGDTNNPLDELTDEVVKNVLGIRAVTIVSPNHLRLTFGGNATDLTNTENYTVTSSDDPAFSAGVKPEAVGIRSGPEFFVPGGGSWPFARAFLKHEVYLRLPDSVAEGRTYTVSVPASVTPARNSITFRYSDLETLNPHLKVNQEGYLPDAPGKWGLLGGWMGTLSTVDYSAATSFKIYDLHTSTEVFSGTPTLRGKASDWKEGGYEQNLSREDLYVCDFSTLRTPGEYYLVVPGMGRSFPFKISIDVYRAPFEVAMWGLLYQRAGASLEGTNSRFAKYAGHISPEVEFPDGSSRSIVGGHYDAGDFNPRAHYEVANLLVLAYELEPNKFYDGQLDIPEKGNGIPDILDEAAWAVRAWMELQDPADGGVGEQDDKAIESPGDPGFVEPAERDPLRQQTFAKNARASFHLAAIAAEAARAWKDLGQNSAAAVYLEAATGAYQFGKNHDPQSARDDYAWAAAELAHTTGEAGYTDDLKASGYQFAGGLSDGEDVRMRAAIAYALNDHANADTTLRDDMRAALIALADTWVEDGKTYAYPHVQHPYAPQAWGTGAYPQRLLPVSVAYHLTGDAKYLEWHLHTCDLGLGANPLNLTYTTGLGDNPIGGPLHLNGWHNYQGRMPPGLQCEGPVNDDYVTEGWQAAAVPQVSDTPIYYRYWDTRYQPATQEGVTVNMAKSALAYALLIPDESQIPAGGGGGSGGGGGGCHTAGGASSALLFGLLLFALRRFGR